MDKQLKTIRLVTERYTELQGLRLALPGAILAVTCGALLIAQAHQREGGGSGRSRYSGSLVAQDLSPASRSPGRMTDVSSRWSRRPTTM